MCYGERQIKEDVKASSKVVKIHGDIIKNVKGV